MQPFNSAFLKITRAQQQCADLQREIVQYYTSPDCPAGEVVAERDVDPRKWRCILHLYKSPRQDWAVRVGEIVHNLRSALDHLVYEASGVDPATNKPFTQTEFPIFNNEGLFNEKAPRRMRGLNDETKASITRDQPWWFPIDAARGDYHPLWALQELSNADKHRLLNLVFVGMTEMLTAPWITPGKTPMRKDHVPFQMGGTSRNLVEDGAEFMTFMTREPIPDDAKVKMDGHITVDVFFSESTPVVANQPVFKILEALGRRVGNFRALFMQYNPTI